MKQNSEPDRMLRIHLLGHPQMLAGDELLPLPTPDKALELAAFLLLKRQQPLSRDHVAFLLWPDVPESEARANLRRHLHLLRAQLPPPDPDAPWILATRTSLHWNPDALCWLDVALLEEFDETSADPAYWLEVMDVYRGPLLEGVYADWVLTESERLHQRFVRLCEVWTDRQRSVGDLQGAIATTRHLLAHEPLREEPYRYLMEFYYRLGDRAAALREFERCEAMLRAELDAEPMPETLALRDEIVGGEAWTPLPTPIARPRHRRPARPGPPGPPRAGTPPVVGPRTRPSLPRRLRWGLAAAALLAVAVAAGLLVAGLLLSPAQPATTSISGPAAIQDTWLNFNYPDLAYDPEWGQDPYAIYPQVHLSYWGYPYDRVLIRFDLSQLPPDAEVEQALFYLHLESFLNEDVTEPLPATVSAFRVLVPWEPDTATFNTPWSQPGLAVDVDFEAQPLGGDSLHGSDWVTVDVTAAVKAWLAHPEENWGLVVMITEAPRGAHYWVDTSDYPLSNRQPHLDITYTP